MRTDLVIPDLELAKRSGQFGGVGDGPAVERLLQRAEEPFDSAVLPRAADLAALMFNPSMARAVRKSRDVKTEALSVRSAPGLPCLAMARQRWPSKVQEQLRGRAASRSESRVPWSINPNMS